MTTETKLTPEQIEALRIAGDIIRTQFDIIKSDVGLDGEDFRNNCVTMVLKLRIKSND